VSSKNGLCVFYVPGTLSSSRRFSCHIILWRGDFQIMLYLYQRWYNCQFKAQFSFKPCFPWPHLCCPRDINWPWVGRYQCIWKWNSNFWLLSSWNSWLQVVVQWKISLEELLGKHNEDGTCWGKKVPPQIYKIQENITNSLFGQKKSSLVNIKPYQKYTKITQNAVFNFFQAKFGVLPFVQECPFYGAFHLSLKPK